MDDDDDDEGNGKSILNKDDKSICDMLRENYMPPSKKEQEAMTKEEKNKIEEKVEKKKVGFKKQVSDFHKNKENLRGLITFQDLIFDKLEKYKH